jgi:hypothetical protein
MTGSLVQSKLAAPQKPQDPQRFTVDHQVELRLLLQNRKCSVSAEARIEMIIDVAP